MAIPPAETTRSPFGWRHDENGVQSIYLPTWLRYRALSWNPAVKRFARARLQNFDVVHIFGLYDLLGPAIAAQCRILNIPYVIEPIGMFLPIVRSFWKKRAYQSLFGKKMLDGARFLIATSEQEADELASGGISREKIFLRRNGVEVPQQLPARGAFRAKHGIPDRVESGFVSWAAFGEEESGAAYWRRLRRSEAKCCRRQTRALCSRVRMTKA